VKQVSDKSEIEALIKSVLQKNLEMVNDYKKGKDKLFGFFVGQVMKESKGKANPQLVNQVLKELLSK
jgi:aspartyl-tRNA(Asn)/glutamyl-tRNA(Gln) amidotransferase subunit B